MTHSRRASLSGYLYLPGCCNPTGLYRLPLQLSRPLVVYKCTCSVSKGAHSESTTRTQSSVTTVLCCPVRQLSIFHRSYNTQCSQFLLLQLHVYLCQPHSLVFQYSYGFPVPMQCEALAPRLEVPERLVDPSSPPRGPRCVDFGY